MHNLYRSFGCLGLVLGSAVAPALASKRAEPPRSSPCAAAANTNYPHAYITNGDVDLVAYLPDAEHGSYRSSRFDWSGIVACASYKGHTFFGAWSDNTDPMGNDTITGPVEEFRGTNGEIGYDTAKPGSPFLKIGVGMLQRLDEKPYHFGTVYPVLDHGNWTVSVHKTSITFAQKLQSASGYGYRYTKTLALAKSGPRLTLSHSLKNTGTQALDSDVYDHDFFVLDGQQVGAGYAVTFGFTPTAAPPFSSEVATWNGKELLFKQTPGPGRAAQGYLTGYTGQPGEYHFELQDRNRHVGVLQTSSSALTRVYFWSTPRTVCPEAYIGVHVQPGATQGWQIDYTFEATP